MNQVAPAANQIEFLREYLAPLPALQAEVEIDRLVATYLIAKEQIANYVDIQGEAKHRIKQLIDQTGKSEWDVVSGKVIVPADATIVTYDAAALDKLAAASAHFRKKVFPFRRESFRPGGIRITGK